MQAFLLLPVLHLALLILGYSSTRRILQTWAPTKPMGRPASEAENVEFAAEVSRIVSIAAQHGLYKATCLRRSLLVWWFLQRDGIPSQISFGVRVTNGRLEAHAWVECGGFVVNDSADVRLQYQTLYQPVQSIR